MSVGGETYSGANPKLPLWNAICRSYSMWLHNFPDVLRVSWLWLIVIGLVGWWQVSWLGGIVANARQGVPPQLPSLKSRASLYVGGLIWLLASTSITVGWYRRIILKERPRLSGSNLFTGSLWRYVGVGLLISVVVFIPLFLAILLLSFFLSFVMALFSLAPALKAHPIPVGLVTVSLMITLCVTAIAVVLRLSLLLPARAVGDRERTLEETWRRTRGNIWRLFWGHLACALLPIIIVQFAIAIILGVSGTQLFGGSVLSTRSGITNVINLICYLLTIPISTNFMALAYLHFFGRNQIEVFD